MDGMVVGRDGAARGSALRRGDLRLLQSLYAAWLLATGCAGDRVGADPNQVVIDTVSRTLPAVVNVEVVAEGPRHVQ